MKWTERLLLQGFLAAAALAIVMVVGCSGDSGGGGTGCYVQSDQLCDAYDGVEANVTAQLQAQCQGQGTWGACPGNSVGWCSFSVTVTRPNGSSYQATKERSFYAPLWSRSSAQQDCQTDGGTFH